jgi:hypothetical protein
MQESYIQPANTDVVVIEGFQGDCILITVEQLENRTMPYQSTAGFLD